MQIPEITLKSKSEIDSQSYQTLKNYLDNRQVIYLDHKSITLQDVEILDEYYYSMCIKDTFDHSDVEFKFRVYKLRDEVYVLFVRHDFKYYFEVVDSIQGVNKKHTWFMQMVIDFHHTVLIPKRN